MAGIAKEGKVIDLRRFLDMETLRSRYDQNWLDWATMDGPDGPIMAGAWERFYVNSLVFYPKAAFEKAGYQVPATWQELLALSDRIVKDGGTPWCIDNDDGCPAANWIRDTMLRTVAPADYYAFTRGSREGCLSIRRRSRRPSSGCPTFGSSLVMRTVHERISTPPTYGTSAGSCWTPRPNAG